MDRTAPKPVVLDLVNSPPRSQIYSTVDTGGEKGVECEKSECHINLSIFCVISLFTLRLDNPRIR